LHKEEDNPVGVAVAVALAVDVDVDVLSTYQRGLWGNLLTNWTRSWKPIILDQ
jgi:hypothetical protein